MNARTKLIGTVALGAALFVPLAQAQSPDDRAVPRGPGGIAAQQADGAANHPDSRAVHGSGVAVVTSTNTGVSPDDRPGPRGPGSIDTVVVQKSDSSGFDWGDATIGSLGGVGFALLLAGGFFLLASQRNKTRVA
jgi:hypothetical protein